MRRILLATLATLCLSTVLWAQNPGAGSEPSGGTVRSPAEKKLLENPNDVQAINALSSEVITAVVRVMPSDPAAARQKLDAMEAFLAELKIDQPAAKSRLAGVKSSAQLIRDQSEVQSVPLAELEKQLGENPNDVQTIKKFATKVQMEISPLARRQPDLAEKKLLASRVVLSKARENAIGDAAKKQLAAANTSLSFLDRQIETGRLSLSDLGKKLTDDPSNSNSFSTLTEFYNKLSQEVSPLMRSQPAAAAQKIEAARAVLQKLEQASASASIKSMVANYQRNIDAMARSVEAGKKLTEMIGKDAAPLAVEAWVNGSPLTDANLKGNVVFLDFWAVWCGPCIATFPHLREWNEKYGDKGLVMIGVTNYYNFRWDEEEKKATRSTEKITPAEEQEMLAKFADAHDLKHRFAIESARSLSEYYGVTGIPHVVVIDQEGKIRLMKVGSGEANAKEIAALLAQLLEPKAAGGQ